MVRNSKWALLVFFPVSACGPMVDDPANIPILGKWSDETRVVSVRSGGAAIDTRAVPGLEDEIADVEGKTESCVEPAFTTKEAFQRSMRRSTTETCDITSFEVNGERLVAKGICQTDTIPGMEGSAVLDVTGRLKPDKVTFSSTVKVIGRDMQTGAGEELTLDIERKMVRLGDC